MLVPSSTTRRVRELEALKLVGASDHLDHGFRRQLGRYLPPDRPQVRRRYRNPQQHLVAIDHEHEATGSQHAADRGHREAAAEQWMGRIGDLNLAGQAGFPVLERGVKKPCRLTTFRTTMSCK